MSENTRELVAAIRRFKEVKEVVDKLDSFNTIGDTFPKDFEKNEQAVNELRGWLDQHRKESQEALLLIIYACLRCLKRIVYLDAVRWVANFRQYKAKNIATYKESAPDEKVSPVNFSVSCKVGVWTVTIPWKKLNFQYSKKRKYLGVRGEYLVVDPETFTQKASDFTGAAEHKDNLVMFDEEYAKCRKQSNSLSEIARKLKSFENSD